MKRQSTYNQNSNLKIILYALGFVLFAGIAFLMVHDIQVPSEHVSQEIIVNLDN